MAEDLDRQPGVIDGMLVDDVVDGLRRDAGLFIPCSRPILILFDVDRGRQVIRKFAP